MTEKYFPRKTDFILLKHIFSDPNSRQHQVIICHGGTCSCCLDSFSLLRNFGCMLEINCSGALLYSTMYYYKAIAVSYTHRVRTDF